MTTVENLTPAYFGLAADWLSKNEINQWLTSEWRGKTVASVMVSLLVRNKKNRLFLVRSDDRPVAVTALADIDPADATAMVWYLLGDFAYARRGIVTEAVVLMARKCFSEMKLESLYTWIMEDNVASAEVLEKAGFRQAGRIRRATNSHGRQVDRIYYDLLAIDCSR